MNESYPASHEFHAGHLHQEWVEDYGTLTAALDDFLVRSSRAQQLGPESRRLLDSGMSNEELDQFFEHEFGSSFMPELDGFTWQSFLQWVIDRSAEKFGDDGPGAHTR